MAPVVVEVQIISYLCLSLIPSLGCAAFAEHSWIKTKCRDCGHKKALHDLSSLPAAPAVNTSSNTISKPNDDALYDSTVKDSPASPHAAFNEGTIVAVG